MGQKGKPAREMAHQYVMAIKAGRMAQRLLERDQPAAVMGVTSRGIFLHLEQDWVVFLSSQPYQGPLTIIVNRPLVGAPVGAAGAVAGGEIRFAGSWVVTGLETALPWEPLLPPADRQSPEVRLHALRATAASVLARGRERGLAALLSPLLDMSPVSAPPVSTPPVSAVDPHPAGLVQDLYCALRSAEWQAALLPAVRLLGLGSGLTPSGDDLLLGLLLAMSRIQLPGAGAALNPRLNNFLPAFGNLVVQAARDRTNSLSASLLACAAQGQADERLVAALDGLLCGALSPKACADLLLDWGSSSGCDALVGMALAILVMDSTWRFEHAI